MQQILRNNNQKTIHPIFNEMDSFYVRTNSKPVAKRAKSTSLLLNKKPKYDISLKALYDFFDEYGGVRYDFDFVDRKYEPLDLPKYDKRNIILAFSGGKDSVAAALYLKEADYNVYLYHLRNYNSVKDEYVQAEKLAKLLDMPLYVDSIKSLQKSEWGITHPLQSMVLYNRMIVYGIENNIGYQIACGDYMEESLKLDRDMFDMQASDTQEFVEAYHEVIRTILPNFDLTLCHNNRFDALNILEQHPDILLECQSCMCQQRFREYNRQQKMKKFNVKLMPNRCGGCLKCAIEYIYYADRGILKLNEDYYMDCIRVLMKRARQYTNKPTIEEVWSWYLGDDISESVLYNRLLNLGGKRGKIRYEIMRLRET